MKRLTLESWQNWLKGIEVVVWTLRMHLPFILISLIIIVTITAFTGVPLLGFGCVALAGMPILFLQFATEDRRMKSWRRTWLDIYHHPEDLARKLSAVLGAMIVVSLWWFLDRGWTHWRLWTHAMVAVPGLCVIGEMAIEWFLMPLEVRRRKLRHPDFEDFMASQRS